MMLSLMGKIFLKTFLLKHKKYIKNTNLKHMNFHKLNTFV